MKIIETEAKSLIQKSKIPSIAYVANPYTGCILGCAYCYASFMGRAAGETVKDWGEYLYVMSDRWSVKGKSRQSSSGPGSAASRPHSSHSFG